jgi:hypothetical protein
MQRDALAFIGNRAIEIDDTVFDGDIDREARPQGSAVIASRMDVQILSSATAPAGFLTNALTSARTRLARLTIPTSLPLSMTGTRLMRRWFIRCTRSAIPVSGAAETISRLMTSPTRRACARVYSSASRPAPSRNSSQRGWRGAAPVSARRKRSPSVTMPTTSPLGPTTGRPLMRCCSIRRAPSAIAIDVAGVTVITRLVIISEVSCFAPRVFGKAMASGTALH